MKKQVSGAIGKSVGHAFSTLPRTFFGGREIALRKDFGACVGKGYSEEKDEGVLKDLYDKFVYQLRESKRPKLTTKDFFEGSKGELTFGFERAGSHTELDYTRKEEVITTHRYPCSNAGGKTGEGNKFVKYDGEELYESPDPQHTTWVLTKTDGGRFGGSNVEVTCEVKGIKVLSRKVELDFNSLNIQCTVPIQGFSGIEG
ncbi:33648_t:CDS:2 [Gigaspora margarita]|uniref:33648_t:CDS:1 n=1 Tax=Gigaspora margarita TaxID=4874 RepID=A0ABM8VXL0_GIGMA|nr:33648_t:CDS:2 [Gigaspora margarita]